MKFFIPHAKDSAQAEELYEATKKFAAQTMGWEIGNKRSRSITYRHDGRDFKATVGEADRTVGEPVIAILESNTYLVCTANRGVLRGMPIMVGKQEVTDIEYFDERNVKRWFAYCPDELHIALFENRPHEKDLCLGCGQVVALHGVGEGYVMHDEAAKGLADSKPVSKPDSTPPPTRL